MFTTLKLGTKIVSGYITVFINGVVTEVPRGSIDIKTMFGQDVMLVHSSGVPLPTNEFGFLMQDLQHGESYFLVSPFSISKCESYSYYFSLIFFN